MSLVYFISDTHFGHRNICKYRPKFNNPNEHDEFIINNWNQIIKKKKIQVWVLGDMCIKNNKYDMDNIISRLNGTINVITGNHCYLPYYNHPNIKLRPGIIKKYGFWLSHAPIHPNELRGFKNIHGHVHDKTLKDKRYFNCCVEQINYKPISIEEIKQKYNITDSE